MLYCKKKIISINSKYFGDYITDLANKYKNSLKLHSINIDNKFFEPKKECEKKMLSSIENYEKYINEKLQGDGSNLSNKKIISKIKEYFFSATHPQ